MNLANRLKLAREHARLTQADLSARTQVKQQVISKLERGIQKETAQILAIARACGVNPYWLDSGEGEMTLAADANYSNHDPIIADVVKLLEALDERGRMKAKLAVEDVAAMHRAIQHKASEQAYSEIEKQMIELLRNSQSPLKGMVETAVESELAKKKPSKRRA